MSNLIEFPYRFSAIIPSCIILNRYVTLQSTLAEPVWVSAIRNLRNAKGMTQGELAEAARIRPNTLSEALNEKTSPRLETLEAVACALGVPVWRLFVDERQAMLLEQQEAADHATSRQADIAARVEQRIMSRLAELVREETAAEMATPTPRPATVVAPAPPIHAVTKKTGKRR